MSQKIKVLKDAHMIDDKTYNYICDVESMLLQNYSEEEIDVLLTHMAMSEKRTYENEEIEPLSQLILNQLTQNNYYHQAQKTLNKIETIKQEKYSDIEQDYLLLHLCHLLGNHYD